MQFYAVDLMDEMPAIGAGHRRVFAVLGRKHVRVLDPYGLRPARMRRADWDALRPREVELTPALKRRLRGTMRRHLKFRPRTKLVERAREAVK